MAPWLRSTRGNGSNDYDADTDGLGAGWKIALPTRSCLCVLTWLAAYVQVLSAMKAEAGVSDIEALFARIIIR